MIEEKKLYYCEKCNRTLDGDEFYASNDLERYPNDGKFPKCKKCLTMHVDNWNPDTYLWILQEADVPYIPDEWNQLMFKYARDRKKVTGMTIMGRYLSKMHLKQYRDYRWKDNEFLQEMANAKIKQTMERQGYDAQAITEAITKATFDIPIEELRPPEEEPSQDDNAYLATGDEDYFADQYNIEMPTLDLTEEDIVYLRLKWGRTYKPDEWVWLEQLYEEMMGSYDIQTAGHLDTLKLVCKLSLKANQLIDIGD